MREVVESEEGGDKVRDVRLYAEGAAGGWIPLTTGRLDHLHIYSENPNA